MMSMRLKKSLVYFLPIFLSLVTTISIGEIPEHHAFLSSGYHLHVADSLYNLKNYDKAIDSYRDALNKSRVPFLESSQFKLAYAYYITGKYFDSARLFRQLSKKRHYLPLYSEFFLIKSLWNYETDRALYRAVTFINDNAKHFLADSLTIPVAEQFFTKKSYHRAREYYLRAVRHKINKSKTAEYKIQAAHCLYKSGKYKLARNEYYQVLKKYSRKEETLELSRWLLKKEADYARDHFFNIAEVYFNNRQYTDLHTLLEKYTKEEKNKNNKEKARYYLLRLYYAKGKYKTALYGFNNLLKEHTNKNLEPRIRLYRARIYNRTGQKTKAIEAYVDYANRFPRRRIAPEAVWKAGWISEQLKRQDGAIELFRLVRTKWPRSEFARDAFFREGFNLYRQGRYEDADLVFNTIRFKRWPDFDKSRAQYWASLARDKMGDNISAKRLRVDLARNLWDGYYNVKSYLMHKAHVDSTWPVIQAYKKSNQFLNYHSNGFSSLLPYFDDVYQIYDVLGENYAFSAIENVKLVASTPEEWVSVAEMYKQFQAYNKAFRVYNYINSRFYRDVPYFEKLFLLKERFPYYHDQIVEKYASRYGLEKEFIFAIIKQESVFDPRAHSWANAYGLMQLIKITAQDMARLARVPFSNTDQLFKPDYNIHLGSLYVKQLSRRLDRKEYILAGYNAGPHRVKRWLKIPGSDMVDVFVENIEYRETRNYVRRVMKNYWGYRLLGNDFNLDVDQTLLGAVN